MICVTDACSQAVFNLIYSKNYFPLQLKSQ